MSNNLLIVTEIGKGRLLNRLAGLAPSCLLAGLKADLYTVDVPVSPSLLIGALTIAAWGGYVQQALATWVAAAVLPDGHWYSDNVDANWLNTSGVTQTAYGVALRDPADGALVAVQRLVPPVALANGGSYSPRIRFTDIGEFT